MSETLPHSTPQPGVAVVGTRGPVLIIGAGLIGGSVGLALRRAGVDVYLRDASPTAMALGESLGAGRVWREGLPAPSLVLVATPPDVTAGVVLAALREFPAAFVFDVSSVKDAVVHEVVAGDSAAAPRYCSVHPMAGKEVNGVGAATADLFAGRPWVVVAHRATRPDVVLAARTLGTDLGAFLLTLDADEHDRAVALVSHVPQLVSSLMAGLLVTAPPAALELAGGGLRDVTRIAASDPRLWNAILAGNETAVREILVELQANLQALIAGLSPEGPREAGNPDGSPTETIPPTRPCGPSQTTARTAWNSPAVGAINTVLVRGNEGVGRIPGKHGDAASKYGVVAVLVPDEPGFLGRLFNEVGSAGINVEDFRLEHSLGQARGLAYLYVTPASVEPLMEHLVKQGWSLAEV